MERIGVNFSGGLPPRDIVDCVKLAEELGYESAWMSEGHGGDQFSILTACAVATNRILLGTSISSVFVRSAPTIAMAAAVVDHFSGGRFILGLGSSHKVQVEPEYGLTFTQPIQRVRECVDIVRIMLRDGEVSYAGKVFNIEHFQLWFQPHRREIPIYVAAVFPKMLEICGEISQGTILTRTTVEYSKVCAEHLAIGAKRAGKDPSDVEVATLMGCSVGEEKDEARDATRAGIAMYAARFPRYRRLMGEYGYVEELEAVRRAWLEGDSERAKRLIPNELIDRTSLIGTAEECRERLAQYRQAGITLPIISPRGEAGEGKDAKALAMEVIRAMAPR